MVYKHLWQTYGQSWAVRFSYLLQLVGRICKLIVLPIAISLIITSLSKGDFNGAYRAVALYVVFSLLLGIAQPLIKYIGMRGQNKWYPKIATNYFSKLLSSDLELFNSNMSGYLTTAVRQYGDSCVMLVQNLRDRYMNTILSIVFPIIVIAWLDPWLGLVTFVLSIVQAVYLVWASQVIDKFRSKHREIYKKNSGRMADIISNIVAVKSAAQESAKMEQISRGAISEARLKRASLTVQSKLIAWREVITVLTFVVLLLMVVHRMAGGNISITIAVLVVTYTTTILNGVYNLQDDVDTHDELVDKIIPAFDILNRENSVEDPEKPAKFDKVRGKIEFKDISFSYDKEKGKPAAKVFHDFSLTIPARQKIGIVGLSGAGKSTLAKLLLRFDDVDNGQILIDGKDIRKVRQTDLRRHIAYVPQEPILFHASIRDNVLLSNPDATNEQIEKALSVAHAEQFVSQLPDGVDSIVGERGVKLSGGQKQRVVIARAVLQDTPIMVLDEATSALDSDSEQLIKDSFAQILRGKTAVVIAHRLSTLSGMDRIIVIEKGRLAEDGTHDELIKKNGVYARLWKRQLRGGDEEIIA